MPFLFPMFLCPSKSIFSSCVSELYLMFKTSASIDSMLLWMVLTFCICVCSCESSTNLIFAFLNCGVLFSTAAIILLSAVLVMRYLSFKRASRSVACCVIFNHTCFCRRLVFHWPASQEILTRVLLINIVSNYFMVALLRSSGLSCLLGAILPAELRPSTAIVGFSFFDA